MSNEYIESKTDLISYLEAGCKAKENWRIGTEHEKFCFHQDTLLPLKYEDTPGIKQVLTEMGRIFAWQPVFENDNIIALKGEDGASVTLEPGGQLELSGATLTNLHQTCDEVHRHLHQVKEVAKPLRIGFLGMGFTPLWEKKQISWMPKQRYTIMRDYMPKVGSLGLDMMLRTATVQVNLDFGSEADMVKKFRTSLALQPLATALFANSPFTDGKPNGYLSFRSAVWNDTDPDRCGMLPFVFEKGMGFERYTEYILDVPMYYIQRNGQMISTAGQSFRDFLAGKLPALPGELPTIKDFEEHLSTAFPEVRLKRILEMRGADGGPWCNICALPAFWVGLLYDADCLDAAWDVVRHWSQEARNQLRIDAPRLGLQAKTPSGTLLEIAPTILEIAERGLSRRGVYSSKGLDETIFLQRLWNIVDKGKTPAEEHLQLYNSKWNQDVRCIFSEYAY